MSKRRRYASKKYKVKQRVYGDVADMRQQEVLEDMLACPTTGCDLGTAPITERTGSDEEVEAMLRELPGVDYVLDRMVEYLFSNGLTTGDENTDETVLNPWLFEVENRTGAVNYEVLKESIRQAASRGECGLRLYDNCLYTYPKGTFGVILDREDGIQTIMAYFVRKDGERIDRDLNREEWEEMNSYGDIQDYFSRNNLIMLDPSEFENIRNNPGYLHGYSPFTRDQQRLDLLSSVYDRMNNDIVYDGPGRIILRPKDGFSGTGDNEVSTTQLVNNSMGAQEARNKAAQQEMKRVGKAIKESSSDSVVLLSNAFDKNIEHLPRVTKSTEFFSWTEQDTVIIAQVLGMSPTLLEVGKLHGNVSVEKIIDNAMLNTIIPKRENYAVQFSKMIAGHLGVSKIYFDKYDLEQVEDENEIRNKVAQTIQKLSYADKASPDGNVKRLMGEFTDYLRQSLYNAKGEMKTE